MFLGASQQDGKSRFELSGSGFELPPFVECTLAAVATLKFMAPPLEQRAAQEVEP